MTDEAEGGAAAKPDVLDQLWCCLDCRWKDKVRKVKVGGHNHFLCPVCGSENLHPAGGQVVKLEAYYGEIGTKN